MKPDLSNEKPAVILEVCANSLTSALAAQAGGAYRVELCSNLNEGGTTPSYGEILFARKLLQIKLYVLIRSRGGDFLFSDLEFNIMAADVRYCVEAGCDGIVIGILNAEGSVDKARCKELIALARQWGLGVTFNRAFDMCANLFEALEDIIEIGCERILTSGGKSTAMEGSSVINQLTEQAAGRIMIMPGSGITADNAADLVNFTGAAEIHSSARKRVPSKMRYKNDHILMGDSFSDEYSFDVTEKEIVQNILKAINE